MSDFDDLSLVKIAYLTLLQMPHSNPIRVRLQGTLSDLRDIISDEEDKSQKEVQDIYEHAFLEL